jgi:hypothetical protein
MLNAEKTMNVAVSICQFAIQLLLGLRGRLHANAGTDLLKLRLPFGVEPLHIDARPQRHQYPGDAPRQISESLQRFQRDVKNRPALDNNRRFVHHADHRQCHAFADPGQYQRLARGDFQLFRRILIHDDEVAVVSFKPLSGDDVQIGRQHVAWPIDSIDGSDPPGLFLAIQLLEKSVLQFESGG